MSFEEYRKYIEPYLDSNGYVSGKSTRLTVKSYIKKFLDFAVAQDRYSEITNELILEYIMSCEGTQNLASREKRVREFVAYAMKQVERDNRAMIKSESKNEVKSAISETEPQESISAADMATMKNDSTVVVEPESELVKAESEASESESEPVQAEAEPESMSNEAHEVPEPEQQAEPAKQRGRPKKTDSEKSNREQISLYMDRAVYAILKEMAGVSNISVSDIICRLAESFIEKNKKKHEENMRNMKAYEY